MGWPFFAREVPVRFYVPVYPVAFDIQRAELKKSDTMAYPVDADRSLSLWASFMRAVRAAFFAKRAR